MRTRSVSALLIAAIFAASAPVSVQGKGHGGGGGGGGGKSQGGGNEHGGGGQGQGNERKAGKSQGGERGQGQARKLEAASRMPDAQVHTPRGDQGRSNVAHDNGRGRGREADRTYKVKGRENDDAKQN